MTGFTCLKDHPGLSVENGLWRDQSRGRKVRLETVNRTQVQGLMAWTRMTVEEVAKGELGYILNVEQTVWVDWISERR